MSVRKFIDPMREVKAALIAKILADARAEWESTLEVSPETKDEETK